MIERCLAKEPAERYASTLDLARELRGLREHLGEVTSTLSASGLEHHPARRARRIATLALLAVSAVATLSWLGPPLVERATVALGLRPVPAEKHIAVLPFRALAPSPDDGALAEGIVDLLTVRLAQLERFQIVALGRALGKRRCRPGSPVPSSRPRALGVTLVVTGSVAALSRAGSC